MAIYINELMARFDTWTIVGLAGQGMFFLRFVCQWYTSEQAGRSIIPRIFWYFSIAGATIVLIYGLHRKEIVLILGQGVALFIYIRNLIFIHRERIPTAARV